jgi:NADH:ubiquinone reductase (H+-translocating)
VLVIDRTNHHLFQPLLYQVAAAVLSPSDIASPTRFLLRKQRNTEVLLANVEHVDLPRHVVVADEGKHEIRYDYLILATGARHAYFGKPEWEPLAPGLKSLEDAREIRRRFLLAFEEAEKTSDPAAREALMRFVVVGAGPTGVELAGILPAIAAGMRRDFRRIDTRNAQVLLLEGGPRVLPTFTEALAGRARRDLEKLGAEVRCNAMVTRIEPDAVYVGDQRIPTRSVFWAAGNEASPLNRSLGAPLDRAGRVRVEPDLSVPGHPDVFVIGDAAAVPLWKGDEDPPAHTWDAGSGADTRALGGKPETAKRPERIVPGVAPAAIQMGRHAARNIRRSLARRPRRTFRYRDKGSLATIGPNYAVADFGRFHLTGRFAWLTWLFVHLLYLVGFRNRVSVFLEWSYAYITRRAGARLISEKEVRPEPVPLPGATGFRPQEEGRNIATSGVVVGAES